MQITQRGLRPQPNGLRYRRHLWSAAESDCPHPGRMSRRQSAAQRRHRRAGGKVKRVSRASPQPPVTMRIRTSAERNAFHAHKILPRPTRTMVTCIDFGLGRVGTAGIGFSSADKRPSFHYPACAWTFGTRLFLRPGWPGYMCRRYAAGRAPTTRSFAHAAKT
jgi:hypothetical protein